MQAVGRSPFRGDSGSREDFGVRSAGRRTGIDRGSTFWLQNGTADCRSVPRSLLLAQISLANSDLLAGVVARIISTAAGTVISVDWPFIDITAVSHCPKLVAPFWAGLYCRVSLPTPAARRVLAQRTLHGRHV